MNKHFYNTVLSLTLLNTGVAVADTVFVEQNGRLIVEIESVAAVTDWHETNEFPGFTGSAAYLWTRPGTTGGQRAEPGAITYHFTINTPGNYEFRWRSRIGEGTNGTEANDSWVRFPTGSNIDGEHPLSGWTKGFMNQINAWSWRTVTVDHVGEVIRQHFTAGDHTLQIAGRSHGHVLDRFALFKYDQVNFNDGVFTNAPQSPHTGDEPNVVSIAPLSAPEPEPEPEPKQNGTPDTTETEMATTDVPAVQPVNPWQIPANLAEAGACNNGVISLSPLSAVNVDNNQIGASGDLQVNGAGQLALLKFNLSAVPATATSAALTMNVSDDAGAGAMLISAGSHSEWDNTDTTLLPDVSHSIRSYDGTWSEGTRYRFPFDPALIGGEVETLFLSMEQGADGISVISKGGIDEPRFQLTGPDTFCADYESNQAVLATRSADLESAQVPEAESGRDGGGSLHVLELLFMTLSLVALGKYFRREM